MSAGPIVIIIVSAALLFAFRAGVRKMSAALDRLTDSVAAATAALGDAAKAPVPDAALNQLAESLDDAVSNYRAASTGPAQSDA